MNAMSAAFKSAGVEPAKERLVRIAVDALARNPRCTDGARDAVYAAVSRDAGLLWELFEPWRSDAVNELLRSVAQAIKAEAREGAGYHLPNGARADMPPRDLSAGNGGAGGQISDAQQGHRRVAPSNPSGDGRAELDLPDEAIPCAPSRSPDTKPVQVVAHGRNRPCHGDGPRPTAAKGKPNLEALGKIAERSAQHFYRGGFLEMLINGRPLGDQTPVELRKWSASQRHQARFVDMAIAGVPEHLPVRQFRKADELEALHLELEDARDVA